MVAQFSFYPIQHPSGKKKKCLTSPSDILLKKKILKRKGYFRQETNTRERRSMGVKLGTDENPRAAGKWICSLAYSLAWCTN